MTKKIIIICLICIIIGIVGWLFVEQKTEEKKEPVLANLQITEYNNPDALRQVINALEEREIQKATIFVGKELVENNCTFIKELDQKGYEIAVFGYALDENGEFLQLANLAKDEQEKIIREAKEAIENCLGHKIAGFRAQRFSQNKDTLGIIKNLGFSWNGSFVINWHPEAAFKPYYSDEYDFYVVSIEGVGQSGYVLCDTAMGSFGKSAKEWRETIQDYFLKHRKEGNPFITEFHPYFLTSDINWWNEFLSLLDWFKEQNINYLTTQQLLKSSCPVCGE